MYTNKTIVIDVLRVFQNNWDENIDLSIENRIVHFPLSFMNFISTPQYPPNVTLCGTNVALCLLDQHFTPVTYLIYPFVFLQLLLFGLWWLHLLVKFSHHVACGVVVCDNHSTVSCLFMVEGVQGQRVTPPQVGNYRSKTKDRFLPNFKF